MMDRLFMEIEIISDMQSNCLEVWTSAQSLMALYMYRFLGSPANIKLCLVKTVLPPTEGKLRLHASALQKELREEILYENSAEANAVHDLRLPVYSKDGNTFIAGTCAVCRELVARQACIKRRKLLGFKESCLLAPAEASIWTRFCEVDIVKALASLLYKKANRLQVKEMPQELTQFELHMNEPVRMHNIYKLAREQAKEQQKQLKNGRKHTITIECSTPKEQLAINHRFAEGVSFTIADLILYPFIRLIFEYTSGMLEMFPLTAAWLKEIEASEPSCGIILDELVVQHNDVDIDADKPLINVQHGAPTSLYKSDPKRYKPRNRIYTEQREVDASLAKLQTLELEFNSNCDTVYDEDNINWDTIEPQHEKSSSLPQERLERKRQQLGNLANAAISLASDGDRIIDFCSGTGHLGILLALQLPNCTVILMENKAISLERAKSRVAELNLTNCRFYQCNIDYFKGSFDLGTSLHACGTATDIVLQQCYRALAKFVCCPCCYGSLQPMPHIGYPLSKLFRTVLTEKDFLHIAHTADQAHELGTLNCKPETTQQGQLCMDIVDTDRKLQAKESGYNVILTRLKPERCTPKNRLLVGYIA